MNEPSNKSNRPYSVGVDVGGTKVAVGVVDRAGAVLYQAKATVAKQDAAASIKQIADLAHRVVGDSSATWEGVEGVGVCIPGIYFAESGAAWTPNLWDQERVALRDELKSGLPVRLVIDSDRAAYVLGEQWLGAARGLSDVVFVAVGTGIGAGIITGGRLCRGAADIAGAVGWFALGNPRSEQHKQTGSFESEASGPAVAHKAAARLAAGEHSSLESLSGGDPEMITTELVVRAAMGGDSLARLVLDDAACYLGMGIANIISILNPQVIVLGGGLMNASDLMLERIRQEVSRWAQPLAAEQCRIELSCLGDNAGLLGAARLVFLDQNY